MKGLIRSAFCVGAVLLCIVGAAAAPLQASFDVASVSSPAQSSRFGAAIDLGQPLAVPDLSFGPADTSRDMISNLTSSVALMNGLDLQFGYKLDLAGRGSAADTIDSARLKNLFLSSEALTAPYASLTSGGSFVGATVALASDLHLSFGSASLAPGYSTTSSGVASSLARVAQAANPFSLRAATSLLGGLSWNIGKWVGLGVTASQTSEHGGVLGTAAPGLNANTAALDFSARLQMGSGWVTTASYSEGITQLDLKPGFNPSLNTDSLHTRSYGISIAKDGLFGDDALGLAVSRPALENSIFVNAPSRQGRPQFFSRSNLLEGATPETDIEVGYITTFLDGALALQTNASYQMNFAGQNGANAVSLLSRARIKF